MKDLNDLYQAVQTLERLGASIDGKLLAEIDTIENTLIEQEIVPLIEEQISPIISGLKKELTLVVDYSPGKELIVRPSKKKKIIFEELATSPEPSYTGVGSKFKHSRSSRLEFRAQINGGPWIQKKFAYETFIEVLEKIGLDKIMALNILDAGIPLISNQRHAVAKQHLAKNGYYIKTHSSSLQKKMLLERIAKELNVNLVVEAQY